MADSYSLVLIPIIIIACFGFVIGTAVNIDDITANEATIFCAWPDYDNGYDESCSTISHPSSYATENSFGFPTGWFTYIAHCLMSFAIRGGAFFTSLGIMLFPISVFVDIPILAIPFAFLYLCIIVGGYKIISPFAGR